MSNTTLTEDELKMRDLVWEIRNAIKKKAFWNARKATEELSKLLDAQPYVEANNE